MTQPAAVCEQLWDQGLHHFVILTSSGKAEAFSGDFEDTRMQKLGAAIFFHAAALLKPEESFKRITMKFDNTVYIASTFPGESQADYFGLLLKKAPSSE